MYIFLNKFPILGYYIYFVQVETFNRSGRYFILPMESKPDKDTLLKFVKQAIEMLCEKNISSMVILSSYKINSVLKENYGINIRVDRIGRILNNLAKQNQLKRLSTNIPKYKLNVASLANLKF